MEQTASTPKQQVVETLKSATNVLVTVSRDPSVDRLASCIGMTLMLNKLGKHATAVFSGRIPSTLEFLQPERTIEANTDSLRDFIISLDRSKADKLRYKVEDEVVKIFTTPYRTSLSDADLVFSQGDFNVDVVVALGVDVREHLDETIVAHGRILHDAKFIGISCGDRVSDIGGLNWHESIASSLSEMLVSISESFQSGLLDSQMSTAFLTGIVAETDRFKNQKTTPKVMTMSAQLMAAGANQQLIATQLALPEEPVITPPEPPAPEPLPEPELPAPEEPIVQTTSPPSLSEVAFETSKEIVEEPVITPPELPSVEPTPNSNEQSVDLHVPAVDEPGEEDANGEVRIHIDDQGILRDEEGAVKLSRQKVIEPLTMKPPEGPKTDLNTYVFEEPQLNTAFTANTEPEKNDEIVNPLSEDVSEKSDSAMPLLSHEPANYVENNAPDVDDVVPAPESLPSAAPETTPTPEISQLSSPDTNLPVEPTLDQLHVDEDAARAAVLEAVAGDPGQPLEKLAGLNAAPMPLDQPMINPSNGQSAPPAVPPPMMPPPDLPLPPPVPPK